MDKSRKVLLVGWDAADWKVIHKLMDEGRMPSVQRLVENGTMGNMSTLFPALSPMLWTSIATGKRPYKHGIYGFIEPAPNKVSVQPMTNLSRKVKALWNILNQNDLTSIVVGWWPSHPAEPIDGVMVSDFFHKAPKRPGAKWDLMKNCVHPPHIADELEPLRAHPSTLRPVHLNPFVPRGNEVDQDIDSRLSVVMRMICECTTIFRAASYLLQTRHWDFAAVYFDAIDHFCHGFMKYHPPRQAHVPERDFEIYQHVVTQGYVYHDLMLGQLLKVAGDDVTVILMSDHGFHPDHLRPKAIPVEPAGPAVEHRDLGIFVACGPGIKKDHVLGGANLLDVTPTILSLYGLPYGEDMDGKPLVEMFEEGIEVLQIPSWETVPGRDGQHPPGTAFDPQQSKETMEQLIALGYIDRPDNDATVAVENCQCELDYNLARAYLDAERYGDAIPLLVDLYNKFPLEFRFGLQLSNCLKAMGRIGELESLVMDLNQRWREAMKTAKKKLRQVRKIMRERRKQYSELQKLDEENKREGKNFPKLAQVDAHGKPLLFSPTEAQAIRKIRAVAKGNPQVLDFLSATIAASKGNFEEALEFMEKAKVSKSTNPTFHYQLGNFYLGLKRPHDAEAAFLKALEIDELHPLALMGLSRTYLELGQPKKGVDFASQAIAIKYHFPLGHYYLGEAKETARDFDGAIASYKTSLQQNPNFSEAHERLARIYKRQRHDSALAKEHATAAKDLNQIQSDYIETVEPIVLKPAESHDFEKLLPKIDEDNTADFVRCLAQAKPMFSRETAIVPDGQPAVVIVTGLPRSGTSMMMQMLVAGGIPAFVDDNRQPDESNPKGYYESEKVKKLAYLNNWVRDCQGKVVKVVAPLVFYLPQGLNYRVILMNRDIDEVVESQEKMLERLNRSGGDLTSDRFAELFRNQLFNCLSLLKIHNIPHCEIEYSEAISDPELVARKVNSFLNGTLDVDAMKRAVDPNLYRQKKQEIVS